MKVRHSSLTYRTVILTGPQDVRALRGTSVLLDCCFAVDPRLGSYQVVWRQGDRKLSESSVDKKYMIFDNGTLRVMDVQLHDTAEYSCEVITDVDKVTAQASITVIGLRTRGNSEGTNMEDVHYENCTPGSTREDSTYQSLNPAGRDQDQTYSTLTHHK
ncbi:neural cell adhesion molecule L1-like [Astatotilapia calliptera]|uniref:neural cell adhesion molecule L1-like n=1 Tax=Astatotilapia calliptera TaxID=8154 RepID=UPI000E4213D4|nr:neural cell adhesion molecule L1-like [Astatotilapia calliptera]